MKIYTKTGDDGTTGLFSGRRVSKTSTYIEAYGTVDEVNAWIGFCATVCKEKDLHDELYKIQNDLHIVCADLATPHDVESAKVHRLENSRAVRLEKAIDKFDSELQPLNQFILAGGSELSSRLHIARTVCRRAERMVLAHASVEKVNNDVVIYLNRLSDFLFVAARAANHRAKVKDVVWDKGA